MQEEILIKNLASNISKYRKNLGLTQLELANKINYSDKSISKWEKGEGIPDILVLNKLADLFGCTINDLIGDSSQKVQKTAKNSKVKKSVITLLSIILVWFVALIVFTVCSWINLGFRTWIIFIYAILFSLIVALVFSCIWGNKWSSMFATSGIVWIAILCFCVTFPFSGVAYAFIIGIPFQVMVLLWFMFIVKK